MQLIKKIYCVSFTTLIISCVSKVSPKKDMLSQATYDSGVGGCSLMFYKDSSCLWMGGIACDDEKGKYLM